MTVPIRLKQDCRTSLREVRNDRLLGWNLPDNARDGIPDKAGDGAMPPADRAGLKLTRLAPESLDSSTADIGLKPILLGNIGLMQRTEVLHEDSQEVAHLQTVLVVHEDRRVALPVGDEDLRH